MYTKVCVSCATTFLWPTGQKSFCVHCAAERTRETQRRYTSHRRGHPLLCPSCKTRMRKGKRMCRLCANVRRANSSAQTTRLRRRVQLYSPPANDSVPGELFAPVLTQGGWIMDGEMQTAPDQGVTTERNEALLEAEFGGG